MLGPGFGFGRRGGSNKNLVAMSESINNSRFGGIVRRHLHFHPIPNCKPNETPAHLSGNVSENQVIVRERDAEHGSRKHRRDGAFQFDDFFRIHDVNLATLKNHGMAGGQAGARVEQAPAVKSNLPALAGKRALPAGRTGTLFARARFVNS
jgi:hypothetical protein